MAEECFDKNRRAAVVQAFEHMLAKEGASIDLAYAALLIARLEYPDLRIEHWLALLDALAARVRDTLGWPDVGLLDTVASEAEMLDIIVAMNRVLFEEEGFHGNQVDYYDPRNSFLNDVLERKTGIPITLSLVYMEVGKRIGVPFEGIGLPLHFVVAGRIAGGRVYIDPFGGGTVLNERQCRERVRRMLKDRQLDMRWFKPVSSRLFLARMLNNLKHIYLQQEEYERIRVICDLLVLLMPASAIERRDRGVVNLHLKLYARALRDFKKYIELAPEADDVEDVQKQINALRQLIAMMN